MPFTLDEVFKGCLGYNDTTLIQKQEQNRVAACLKRLGYRRRRETFNCRRAYWWRKRKTQKLSNSENGAPSGSGEAAGPENDAI